MLTDDTFPPVAFTRAAERLGKSPLGAGDLAYLPLDSEAETTKAQFAAFAAAQTRIDLVIRDVSNPEFWDALRTAARRGVRVRVLLGHHPATVPAHKLAFIDRLRDDEPNLSIVYGVHSFHDNAARLDVLPEDHRKFMVIDERTAYIGDQNVKPPTYRNRAAGVFMCRRDGFPDLVALFSRSWEERAGRTEASSGGGAHAGYRLLSNREVTNNIRFALIRGILEAKSRIHLSCTKLQDPLVVAALGTRRRQAPEVDVRVLLNDERKKPKLWPPRVGSGRNALAAKHLEQAGVPTRWFRNEEHGNFTHAKLAIFDDKLITGSSDLEPRAYYLNEELAVELDHPPLVEHFARIFREDWDRSGDVSPGDHPLTGPRVVRAADVTYLALVRAVAALRYLGGTLNWPSVLLGSEIVTRHVGDREPLKSGPLYRGLALHQWQRLSRRERFNVSSFRRNSISSGVGIFASDSKDIAALYARKKRAGLVVELKPKRPLSFLHLDAQVLADFRRWCRTHFGLPAGECRALFPVYVMALGHAGYHYRKFRSGHCYVIYDSDDFELSADLIGPPDVV